MATARAATATEVPPPSAPWHAWYGLGVLIVATLFSFVDREILSLVAEPVRKELSMSDTQLGILQGLGMALFTGVASLPIAWVADKFGRRWVLVVSVLVWSVATAACGAAHTFSQLFGAMVLLGIGQAGLGPVVFGMIPDLFPPQQRVLANTLYALVATLGAALGLVVGGPLVTGIDAVRPHIPEAFRDVDAWRLAFYLVAVPGPLIAMLIVPMRLNRFAHPVTDEGTSGQAEGMGAIQYVVTQSRTVAGLFGSIGLIGFGFGAIGTWAPIVAVRTFGATPTEVGQGLGLAMGIGTVLGGALVTPAAKWFGRRHGIAASLRAIQVGVLVTLPLCVVMTLVGSSAALFTVVCLEIAPLTIGTMLFNVAMQDMSPAHLRSRVLAIGTIVTLGFSAVSPVVVGLISDGFGAAPKGLLWSTVIVALVGLVTGSILMRWAEPAFVNTVRRFTPDPASGV